MRIQHHLDSGIYDGHGGEIWGGFLYDATVGLWWMWLFGFAFGFITWVFISHAPRKRKRNIRDLARQGRFHEASIASAQHERAQIEEAIGANAGVALGAVGHRDRELRNTMFMLSGAGVIANTRQLEHFDSIDFEDHRRRHEAHLRNKYPAPPEPARPAQHNREAQYEALRQWEEARDEYLRARDEL